MKWLTTGPAEVEVELVVASAIRVSRDPVETARAFLRGVLHGARTLDAPDGPHPTTEAIQKAMRQMVLEERGGEEDLQTLAIQFVVRSFLQSEDPEKKARELLGGVMHEASHLDREHHHHQGTEALLRAMEEILFGTDRGTRGRALFPSIPPGFDPIASHHAVRETNEAKRTNTTTSELIESPVAPSSPS